MTRDADADAWYFNLESMARRIEANEKRATTLRRRQWTALIFFMFAFLLLSYRSEVSSDRIAKNTERISNTQDGTCRGGLEILTRFNALQDQLVAIEQKDPTFNEEKRRLRIQAYEGARILPLPDCPQARGSK